MEINLNNQTRTFGGRYQVFSNKINLSLETKLENLHSADCLQILQLLITIILKCVCPGAFVHNIGIFAIFKWKPSNPRASNSKKAPNIAKFASKQYLTQKKTHNPHPFNPTKTSYNNRYSIVSNNRSRFQIRGNNVPKLLRN